MASSKLKPNGKKAPRRSPAGRLAIRLLKVAYVLALVFVPLVVGATYVIYRQLSNHLPDVSGLASYAAPQTTRILASDGEVVATLFEENRTAETYDHISPNLIKALVAVEDSRFFQHHGVDWVGVGRAVVADAMRRGIDQGASTITMQLARNRFLTRDQNMARKLREALLALQIEKHYDKKKILELYLNNVYFGSGAYGVGAASSLYFHKRAADLDLAEGALIAGLVQAPSSLSPLVNAQAAKHRQKIVLQRMVDTGDITRGDYEEAVTEGEAMKFSDSGSKSDSSEPLLKHPYFTTYCIAELAKHYSTDLLYRGGLDVDTTLDVKAQSALEEVAEKTMAEMGHQVHADTCAMVLIENSTGFVRAMVGGRRWSNQNQFNRAWQAVRQPGSSFKPFVYGTALLNGYTPETIVPDKPVKYGTWAPKNSDGRFMGTIPLRMGLQYSRNTVSAQLIEALTPNRVIRLAHALGIAEELPPAPSLALGSCEVSVLSMANAYSSIASGGRYRVPTIVTTVTTPDKEVLTDNRQGGSLQVMRVDAVALLVEMMTRVVKRGTGTGAFIDGLPMAGKTGTTDDSRDAWFCGFTPDYTLAVWVGNDDHSRMYNVFGGGLPATLWRRSMLAVTALHKPSPDFFFFKTGTYKKLKLCSISGELATPGCKSTYQDVFRCGVFPTELCPLHRGKKPVEVSPTPGAEAPSATPDLELTPAPTPLSSSTPAGTETPAPDAPPDATETPDDDSTP
jgi:penicillin-binding protein 1A